MRVAAVDIGTNSTRLLIAEGTAQGLRWIERRAIVTGLGKGVDALAWLSDERMDATTAVLQAYRQAASAAGAERIRAVATSAVRDAVNREVFLGRAEAALGVRPDLISGDAEARLSFLGATAELDGEPPYLVIDPGGGSTEFVLGTTEPDFVTSVDIGSVRLTERSLPSRPSDPLDVVAASASVEAMFWAIDLPAAPGTVVGVGGTYTSLGAIALDLPAYDRLQVHGSVLPLERLTALVGELAAMTVEETAAIPSLDPARAPVLLGGAVVAEAALRRSGSDRIVVSEADILDGIAQELLEEAS
ncbi:MAG TPA: Ppx/GppA phosphatase family protein [Acidimicrobiia bacterium]|nr:Ppx/GppA phosphatase family protein [Acidimicrobiia bacterium]